MAQEVAIRVENLGKRYLLKHLRPESKIRYTALRDVIASRVAEGARSVGRLLTGRGVRRKETREDFWALKDLSFEIKKGESVAIIGRNGAGKSTLLKLLSRITEPTTGVIGLNGRVASLLEVGTGFHPELTGRENIYLNGAILGMPRAEIRRKFDEIVAFAEVERFLDTPVKRYSSGMYVRLAFSVAAHLEPDVLIVDEVLAVGDAKFQKKCLGRMETVSSREGGTVIFVSHNLQAVQTLCSKGILLERGEKRAEGDVRDVIGTYLDLFAPAESSIEWPPEEAPGNEQLKVASLSVTSTKPGEEGAAYISSAHPILIDLVFDVQSILENPLVGLTIKTRDQETLFFTSAKDPADENAPRLRRGRNHWQCEIPGKILNAGVYRISIRIAEHNQYWIAYLDDVVEFTVYLDHGEGAMWAEHRTKSRSREGSLALDLPWREIK
jgi:lipopolysaccharide transport system ATP-binding protein